MNWRLSCALWVLEMRQKGSKLHPHWCCSVMSTFGLRQRALRQYSNFQAVSFFMFSTLTRLCYEARLDMAGGSSIRYTGIFLPLQFSCCWCRAFLTVERVARTIMILLRSAASRAPRYDGVLIYLSKFQSAVKGWIVPRSEKPPCLALSRESVFMTALFQKACETGKWPETVPDRMRVEKMGRINGGKSSVFSSNPQRNLVQMIPSQTDLVLPRC
jgi:hypothetical protein